ncbi:hypothetical protein [Sorangium cellulosum]|uniref:Uncharacterized protein n=1 Tax=Sorangium cellulosum So0157-2 TaxID=1254432 RepID=S4XQI1_SORCE|nr:hypothetical protein [Sorangium cellulosum]AGP34671.1 hypothetical protein SCE1572_09195 [Sorangium cellulosum So0157-2]
MKPPTTSASAPYRMRTGDDPSTSGERARTDVDLAAVLGLAWLACLLTTLSAISRGEAFGGATTVAALIVILVPYLLQGWLRSLSASGARRRRERARARGGGRRDAGARRLIAPRAPRRSLEHAGQRPRRAVSPSP